MENFFSWDDALETGNDDIDRQHKTLIHIINESVQLTINHDLIREEDITNVLEKLMNYVSEHFDTEEQLMRANNVDERHMVVHSRTHQEFRTNILHQFTDIEALTEPKAFSDIIEFLIRWLAYHILYTDKGLVRQIDAIQSGHLTPEQAYENELKNNESNNEPILKALRALFVVVSRKNAELEMAKNELEEKVKLRTQELSEANERLKQLSVEDELTRLPNRRYAISELEMMLNNWVRYKTTFSILFIDLDRFKQVNDAFGHEQGDIVLKTMADFLRTTLRKTDIPCRLGGDEFLVICNHCDYKDAQGLVHKLNDEIVSYFDGRGIDFWKPSLSIGIAEVCAECSHVSQIINKADEEMYKDKYLKKS